MILYKSSPDSPDETARAIEFSKAERFAQVTNYVPLEGGSSIRLFNNQLVALIFYPKIEGQTISSPEQIALLRGTAEQMKMTATKFPTTLERLTPPYRAVQAALAEIDSGKVLIAGEWKDKAMIGAPTSGGETLKVKLPDGTEREYTGVQITGKNIDSLKIMHSGGAATIPYEQLPEELQKQHGFDPLKIAELRKDRASEGEAMPAKSDSGTTNAVSANSSNGISFRYGEIPYGVSPEEITSIAEANGAKTELRDGGAYSFLPCELTDGTQFFKGGIYQSPGLHSLNTQIVSEMLIYSDDPSITRSIAYFYRDISSGKFRLFSLFKSLPDTDGDLETVFLATMNEIDKLLEAEANVFSSVWREGRRSHVPAKVAHWQMPKEKVFLAVYSPLGLIRKIGYISNEEWERYSNTCVALDSANESETKKKAQEGISKDF